MADARKIVFYRVREFGDVLNATFVFLRQNAAGLGRALLTMAGPFVLVGGALLGLWTSRIFRLVLGGRIERLSTDELALLGLSYLGVMLVTLVALVVVMSVVNAYVYVYIDSGREPFGDAEVRLAARRNLGRMATTGLWLLLLLVAGSMLSAIPCLGAAAFLGLAVYFGPVLALVPIARICEGLGFRQALARCRGLADGQWGPTFGVLVVSLFLQTVAGSVFALPYYLLLFLTGVGGEVGFGSAPGILLLAAAAFSFAASFLLYAIPLVAMAFQYFNLVERREATNLFEGVERLGD